MSPKKPNAAKILIGMIGGRVASDRSRRWFCADGSKNMGIAGRFGPAYATAATTFFAASVKSEAVCSVGNSL
jgi:hypothetical protein